MPVYRPTTHRVRTASVAALAVIVTIVIYGLFASLRLATTLGYVPALGRPLIGHIYPPFAWVAWSFRYYRADPPAFARTYWFFLVTIVTALGLAVTLVGLTTRKLTPYIDAQGTARFLADTAEIRHTGLLPKRGREGDATGVLLGLWHEETGRAWRRVKTHYLRHPQIEHIQLFGPPGSGKGVAFVFNAINTWNSSMVVLDRKGSLHEMASGYLAANGWRVLRWAPTEAAERTIGINLLDTIRFASDHEVGDAINFAKALIPSHIQSENTFFTDGAARLLGSVVLYVLYKVDRETSSARRATLADVVHVFGSATKTTTELYTALAENTFNHGKRHKWIADMGAIALKGAKSERTDANIFETAFQKLLPATDPMVQVATESSDLHLDDLMNGPDKIALFLVMPPSESDLQRLSGIFTTLLSMMIEIPTRRTIKPKAGMTAIPHERPLMILLDEIGNVGRINALPGALTQLREYGVKIIGIWQSLTQITKHYGKDNPILGASEIQMSFAPNDLETAEWLSARLGTTTVVTEDVQMSGHRFGWGMHNVSKSMGLRSRPLMTPDETMRLPGPTKDDDNKIIAPGEILIMKRGEQPIRAVQALWWNIPALAGRPSAAAVAKPDSKPSAAGAAARPRAAPALPPGTNVHMPAQQHSVAA